MISRAANAMSASHINDEDLSSGPHFTPAQNDDITSYTESYTESCTESYTESYTESCTSLFRRVCKCGSDQEAIKASPKHGRVSAARTQTRVCPIDSPISLQFHLPSRQTNVMKTYGGAKRNTKFCAEFASARVPWKVGVKVCKVGV